MRVAHLADGTAHRCVGGHWGWDNMRLSWNYPTYFRTAALHIAAECTGRTDLVAPFRRLEKAPA